MRPNQGCPRPYRGRRTHIRAQTLFDSTQNMSGPLPHTPGHMSAASPAHGRVRFMMAPAPHGLASVLQGGHGSSTTHITGAALVLTHGFGAVGRVAAHGWELIRDTTDRYSSRFDSCAVLRGCCWLRTPPPRGHFDGTKSADGRQAEAGSPWRCQCGQCRKAASGQQARDVSR